MRDLAVAIVSATVLGLSAGNLLRLPASAQPSSDGSFWISADEDPNVTLYRAAMGGEWPSAPQPYVPLPPIASEPSRFEPEPSWPDVEEELRTLRASWVNDDRATAVWDADVPSIDQADPAEGGAGEAVLSAPSATARQDQTAYATYPPAPAVRLVSALEAPKAADLYP